MKRLRLSQRRRELGYSQEKFAEQLQVATSTIVRWERGETTPQPYQRPKVARLLQVTPAELDVLLAPSPSTHAAEAGPEDPPTTGEADDMKRRDFLSLLTVTATLVALPPTDALAQNALSGRPAESGAEVNAHLWKVFGLTETKQAAYPLVRHQLGSLVKALATTRDAAEHRVLCTLAGDLYQLVGEIFFDANRYTDAAHSYTLAANAARQAGAFDLWACAMTRHAFVELYEKRFTTAAPILSAAALVARRGDGELSTWYWIAAVQAEAYAGLGDLDGCMRALDTADQVHALGGTVQNGGWLRFDGSRLAEERGTCYLALGRPDLAEPSLTAALRQELSPRRRGAVLAELAVLGAQRRDIDQVVEYSAAAIDLAGQTGSGYIGRKLEAVRDSLAPAAADGRVSELRRRIAALSGTT
ncbi:helix-turn-helix transcriptional regulator [Kitasatospora purpeofusca]|uniref:helix-turn-helix transcriptional regulator n=1 Tax=Kitasatospora purpeofusca TaxID=67352 RepID=UPI0036D40A4A